MARAINWARYDHLKAQGRGDGEVAQRWGIPWSTFHRERQKRDSQRQTSPPISKLF